MAAPESSTVAFEDLREAVAAGPGGAAGGIGDDLRVGILGRLAGEGAVDVALKQAEHRCVRNRVLTGPVTMLSVLGACLFSGRGYASVLRAVFPALSAMPPRTTVPDASAFSLARARLGADPMRALFELTAASAPPLGPGALAFGMEVTAFDGTTLELFATDELIERFGVPTGGRRPLAQVVTLVSCGSRRIRAAAFGPFPTSEQALCDDLTGALGPGMVNLADRNFFSMARWGRMSATGAHLLWRVRNDAKSLPIKIIEDLPDGSALVRLRESCEMRSHRRRAAGDYTLPHLPDQVARLVEFDLVSLDQTGRRTTSRLRLLTTLLDHQAYPADQLAELYAERWQIELSYLRIKKTLRGARTPLRGRSAELVRQEIWALLIVYNALCDLAAEAAALDGIDPDEISFIAVVRLTRAAVTADQPCQHCHHRPSDDPDTQRTRLLNAILFHPRNRTGRQRTGPRTTIERRTEHTRKVNYTIEIVASNLPKTA